MMVCVLVYVQVGGCKGACAHSRVGCPCVKERGYRCVNCHELRKCEEGDYGKGEGGGVAGFNINQ